MIIFDPKINFSSNLLYLYNYMDSNLCFCYDFNELLHINLSFVSKVLDSDEHNVYI